MSRLFGTYLVALMLPAQSALAVWVNREHTDEFTDEITYSALTYDIGVHCRNGEMGVIIHFWEELDTFVSRRRGSSQVSARVRFDDGEVEEWEGSPTRDYKKLYLYSPEFLKKAIASDTVRVNMPLLMGGSKTLTIDMSGAEEAIAAAFASGGCKPLKRKPSTPSD